MLGDPKHAVATNGGSHQLDGAPRNDRNYGCANAVRRSLNPRKAAEAHIAGGEGDDHQKRTPNEGDAGECSAEHPVSQPAEIDCELRRQRSGRELAESEALQVVLLREPRPLFDQVCPTSAMGPPNPKVPRCRK